MWYRLAVLLQIELVHGSEWTLLGTGEDGVTNSTPGDDGSKLIIL